MDAQNPTDAEIRATMTSEQILLERKLTCEAINGAMAFGYQDSNPPPSEDHWLAPFWKIGRQQAELESRAAPPSDAAQAPVEMSPEFTDSARAALVWVLYHHQGGSSPVGQPIRFALGMGAHDPLTPSQIGEALKLAEASRWPYARELPRAATVVADAAAPTHHDDECVDRFAEAMKAKLARAREKGRSGWEQCAPADLSRMLREHVEKGDPRDVANFCMFLWTLGDSIEKAAQPNERDGG